MIQLTLIHDALSQSLPRKDGEIDVHLPQKWYPILQFVTAIHPVPYRAWSKRKNQSYWSCLTLNFWYFIHVGFWHWFLLKYCIKTLFLIIRVWGAPLNVFETSVPHSSHSRPSPKSIFLHDQKRNKGQKEGKKKKTENILPWISY